MNSTEFVKKLKDIALNYKTLYVMGCFGAPLNAVNKIRYTTNTAYNRRADRSAMIRAASADTFGFDCVNLIKGILWGWNGNKNATYGGAVYSSNGVPDINDTQMFNKCYDKSDDFSRIIPGEAVWLPGHIGIYIGDGLAVECTPAWRNNVQITSCNCYKAGYYRRDWQKHGKLPYIKYVAENTVETLAHEVMQGKWGNEADRKKRLENAGYDYRSVQDWVNRICRTIRIVDTLAQEVLEGKWGNGNVRREQLISAGYDYRTVQDKVNEIVKK